MFKSTLTRVYSEYYCIALVFSLSFIFRHVATRCCVHPTQRGQWSEILRVSAFEYFIFWVRTMFEKLFKEIYGEDYSYWKLHPYHHLPIIWSSERESLIYFYIGYSISLVKSAANYISIFTAISFLFHSMARVFKSFVHSTLPLLHINSRKSSRVMTQTVEASDFQLLL